MAQQQSPFRFQGRIHSPPGRRAVIPPSRKQRTFGGGEVTALKLISPCSSVALVIAVPSAPIPTHGTRGPKFQKRNKWSKKKDRKKEQQRFLSPKKIPTPPLFTISYSAMWHLTLSCLWRLQHPSRNPLTMTGKSPVPFSKWYLSCN